MSNTAIKVEHVSKEYRLGMIGGTTLRADLQRLWAKMRGKEDPTAKIGADTSHIGERFLALDDVSFEVKQGEALGIIGHNGAGKSTLLKLLARVTAPTKGKISYNGRIASMLEVGTGFHGELSGRENIYMNGAILGMSKKEIDRKLDEIVTFAEMEQFIDTPVKRYSSGMYVKLAFSVAAHLDAEIMIMDEVLAVGDMKFQQKCLGRMDDAANNEGRTVLYVSHNMNTIRQLCQHCVVLEHGQISFNGDVEKAIEIYSGKCECSQAIVNLAVIKRAAEYSHHPITLQSFEILDRSVAVYHIGEKMLAKITLFSKKNFFKVFLRLKIKSGTGMPVMMVNTSQPVDIKSDVTNEYVFDLDISMLAPAKYTLGITFYLVNEFGTDYFLDGLNDCISFEMESVSGFNNNMPWLPQFWGYVYGASLKILK